MTSCDLIGNSDMYGLGIRLGFYILWFGSILAPWVSRAEAKSIVFANDLFVFATFLALVIQTVEHAIDLVEIYIILLFTFGAYFYFAPLFLWRILTGFQARWDPSRYPRDGPSSVWNNTLRTALYLAIIAYQLWFWLFLMPTEYPRLGCDEYGFLFTKVKLDNTALKITNIVLNFIVGTILIYWLAIRLDPSRPAGPRDEERRIWTLMVINTVIRLLLASAIVVATELTIIWNHVQGVHSLTSAGQFIPVIVAIGAMMRIPYARYNNGSDTDGPEGPADEGNVFHLLHDPNGVRRTSTRE